MPVPPNAAAAPTAAPAFNHRASAVFETESPGALGLGAGGVDAVDWRQEWNSL
jgi:hypothetical protein